jgi:hypothetical protein
VSYKLMFCCVFTYHFKCCYCSVFHVIIMILDTNKMALTLLANVYEMTPTKISVLQYFFESHSSKSQCNYVLYYAHV